MAWLFLSKMGPPLGINDKSTSSDEPFLNPFNQTRSLRWVIKAPDRLGNSHRHLLCCYWKKPNRTTDARKQEVLFFVVVAYVVDPTRDLGIAWIYFWSPTWFLLNTLQQLHMVWPNWSQKWVTDYISHLWPFTHSVYSQPGHTGWLEPFPIPGICKLYTELSLRSNALVVGWQQESNHPTPVVFIVCLFFLNITILYYQDA